MIEENIVVENMAVNATPVVAEVVEDHSAEIAEVASDVIVDTAVVANTTPDLTTGQKIAVGAGLTVIGAGVVYGGYKLGKFLVRKGKEVVSAMKERKAEKQKEQNAQKLEALQADIAAMETECDRSEEEQSED